MRRGHIRGVHHSRQAEISYFSCAVRARHQNVSRFDITMNNVGRVNVLQPDQNLIQHILDVLCLHILVGFYNISQVCVHIFKYKVQVTKMWVIKTRHGRGCAATSVVIAEIVLVKG